MDIRNYLIVLFLFIISCSSEQRTDYLSSDSLQKQIVTGWNTWDNRNLLSHIYLPDGLTLHMSLINANSGDTLRYSFTGNRVKGSENVKTIAHTPDGSYTDFTLQWQDLNIRSQSASSDKEITILISNLNPRTDYTKIIIEPLFQYDGIGQFKIVDNKIIASCSSGEFSFNILSDSLIIDDNKIICPLKYQLSISTSTETIGETIKIINGKYLQNEEKSSGYKELSEVYNVIQNSINWLVVFDHIKGRAVTPVSRPWSYGWGEGKEGGYILFCWDNFFAAYMHAIESKELAFNEAIEMCKEIDDLGFVPNFSGPFNLKSRDRSQPPVGSLMIREIYKLHSEKWFLEEVFDRLLIWNRWWKTNRDNNGFLCWGSNPYDGAVDIRMKTQNSIEAALYESGLDNTPMYDNAEFDQSNHLMKIADVGLMSLYIADCIALADIAKEIGRDSEYNELSERAEFYNERLQTMWDDDFGMFLNKHTDTGELSRRISPTNFYPLISRTATQSQAERMIKEHFYNPDEFWGEYILPSIARNDTGYTAKDYWRGSIWAPMNFLVYLGLRNYDLLQARRDLAEKSKFLLLKNWKENGYVRENYHAETGGDPDRSDHFYHWGALLGMISMIENDYLPKTELSLN